MKIKILASGSKGNCYLIDDGKNQLLLDAGIPFKTIQSKLNFKTAGIAGVLITHRHGDHSLAVNDLLKRGIRVYGNEDMKCFNSGIRTIEPYHTVGITTFDVTPYPMEHDVECYGYEIYSYITGEKLVYITDTANIPHSFQGMNYLMVEANHDGTILKQNVANGLVQKHLSKRILESHMEINHLIEWLMSQDRNRLLEVYLLHLSDRNSDEKAFKDIMQMLTTACVYCENWQ